MKKVFLLALRDDDNNVHYYNKDGSQFGADCILTRKNLKKRYSIDPENPEKFGFTEVTSDEDKDIFTLFINFNVIKDTDYVIDPVEEIFYIGDIDDELGFAINFSKLPGNIKVEILKKFHKIIKEYERLSDSEKLEIFLN